MTTEHFVYNELYEELNQPADPDQELEFILSLGCGQTNIRLNDYEYDFSSFSRVDRLLKFAIDAKPFSMILISKLNNTEHHKLLRTMAWCKSMNIPYVRLSPFFGEKVNLDERNDEMIVNGRVHEQGVYTTSVKELKEVFYKMLKDLQETAKKKS